VLLRLVAQAVALEAVVVLAPLVPLLLAAVQVPVLEVVPGAVRLPALLVQLLPPAALVLALVQDLVGVQAPVVLAATGE